jgi:hypothetical protein
VSVPAILAAVLAPWELILVLLLRWCSPETGNIETNSGSVSTLAPLILPFLLRWSVENAGVGQKLARPVKRPSNSVEG